MCPRSSRNVLVASSGNSQDSTSRPLSETRSGKVLKRLQVQIVHRHGDRSPITSLKDEAYWQKELIPKERLQEIARNVTIASDDVVLTHKANGRGPFGKLTTRGLQQMVDLGILLQQELFAEDNDICKVDTEGNLVYPFVGALQPSNVRVLSTSFERAIQSAQGVIQGLFQKRSHGDAGGLHKDTKIEIDARHTVRMLPDPQPRETEEQIQLEDALAARPHLEDREMELLPLAVKVTAALHPLLAADAHEAVFGAKQKQLRHTSAESIEVEPLAWNQLAEITKCLACRDLLPDRITQEDHDNVVQHAAWRWFESFRHPRLAYLGMHRQCAYMVATCQNYRHEPPLTLYSAHDSTLIGLLCALKLEQPIAWPEYGSFLMMELLQVSDISNNDTDTNQQSELYVRFSLNGELLRTTWDEGVPTDMILLGRLAEKLKDEDQATQGMTEHASDYRYSSN